MPCVVVGISRAAPTTRGPDILLSAAPQAPSPWVPVGRDLDDATRSLADAVTRNPAAAATLAQVLRASRTLGVEAALLVESLAYGTLQAGSEHRVWLGRPRSRRADGRTGPAVTLDRHDDQLWITLDRAERRNAYSARMRDELVAALAIACSDDSVAAIHLRGRGPSFCSGGDLAEFGQSDNPAMAHAIRSTRGAARLIDKLGPRMHAHLHGAVIGAGIELAAFAGTVQATADTTVRLPEVGMGLVPGAGGTVSIPRRIGRHRAAWLAISGAVLDAPTALRWGLFDELVPMTILDD
jgi:enoyl-CoA hydratase/carnithine racemase